MDSNLVRRSTFAVMAEIQPKQFAVTVHPYPSKGVKHACAYELGSTSASNALLFIGGLTDGPHTVPYIRTVAAKIEAATGLSYSVFEIRIRSSFDGFGWSSLAEDVEDISAVVKYLRSIGKEKVVLMGHSTGSQVSSLNSRHSLNRIRPLTLWFSGLHRVQQVRQIPE